MTLRGIDVGKKLVDAGIVPGKCYRVVIDIQIEGSVKVYYAMHAQDDAILPDLIVSLLAGAEVIKMEPKP